MSITELQQHLEAVRQEAFANGYAAAMKEVKELTARATPDAAVVNRNGDSRTGTQQTKPTSQPVRRRRRPRTAAAAGRSRARLSQRGTNAVLVAEVLKSAAPGALRQAEIRRALQDKGKTMSFPSIGYSLRQLVARDAARQVGNSKTWRHR